MSFIIQVFDFFLYSLKHPRVKRVVVVLTVLLVVDIFLLGVYWWPAAWHHHEIQKQIDDYISRKAEAQQVGEMAGLYTLLLKRVKTLESKLQTASTQSELIESLTRLASQNGLRIISQDFDTTKNNRAGFTSFKQNITLAGGYSSIRRYMIDLENLPTLTIVQQARLERAGDTNNQVRATFQLLTFEKPSLGAH